ncbi:MAG: Rieske (2Fe-2S) domain protein [Chlorobi bacterium]|jgi:cytochrome b6-f complex iron-sulfur subunit|nr:Rieske (2Fe-2S) domain protein [Chlorobiota bacterium]
MTAENPDTPDAPRRNAITILLWSALATIAAPVVYVAGRFIRPPAGGPATAVAGTEAELGATPAHILKVGSADAIVMRDPKGALYALNLRCTHAGCNVHWNPANGGFACPCHGGRFDRNGQVVKGPPRMPLRRMTVTLDNGVVIVSDKPSAE